MSALDQEKGGDVWGVGKGLRIGSDRPKVCWIKLIFSEKQTTLGASSKLKEISPSVQSQ